MMARILVAICALHFGWPMPAHATPPDMISVQDSPFGIGADRIYVLRTTSDNLGSYYEWRNEVWLVAIDPVTGDETMWPVHAATRTTEFGEVGAPDTWIVNSDPIEGQVNPYVILAEGGAIPWSERSDPQPRTKPVARKDDVYSVYSWGGSEFQLRANAMSARYSAAITELAERVANARRMSSITTRELYTDRFIDPQECTPKPFGWPIRLAPSGVLYHPVRVTCGDPDDGDQDTLIQFAKMAPAAPSAIGKLPEPPETQD